MSRIRLLLALVCLLSLPSVSHAQDAAMESARQHFEAGQDLFDKADFAGAAKEFMAAYDAKAFPAFLFNAAVCAEKQRQYRQAADLFLRYLSEDPRARDQATVEKRVAAIEEEIARLAQVQVVPEPTTLPSGTSPTTQPSVPPVESSKIAALPEARPKGLVVIESKPPGATIFIDDKKKGAVGVTPWNGSLDGEHTVILESRGFKSEKKKISPSSDKLLWIYVALSQEHYLGWLEVRANIPGADVYIDNKDVGAVGRTPYMGNVQPGKHRIIVTKEGHTEVDKVVDIEPGKAHNLDIKLETAPIGFVRVRGNEASEGAHVSLDGKEVCSRLPCRFQTTEGSHDLAVWKKGKKTYARSLRVDRATETQLMVRLASKPGKGDAIWAFVFAAAFAGGGAYVGKMSDDLYNEIQRDINAGTPPPDPEDERFRKGKLYAYGADGLYLIGAVAAVSGIYYLFRDEGPASTGTAETRELSYVPAIVPMVTPGFAGLSAEVRW
jgi:hypothetical protein